MTDTEPTDDSASAHAKGRPTRSRAEAEAERKAMLNPTVDKRAQREAQRKQREAARLGQLRGDERFLPARDRGPVRAFVRDYVDGRFNVGEIVMPAAFIFIFINFIKLPLLNLVTTYAFFAIFLAMIGDQVWLGFRLRRAVQQKFGAEGTKGSVLYAIMRCTQIRRLRVPAPKVKRGQKQS